MYAKGHVVCSGHTLYTRVRMATLYTIAQERAKEFLELPEELPGRPAGYSGTRITGGHLPSEYEHNIEFRTPRRRALMVGRMLRTSPILSLAEEYLTGLCTAVKLTVKRNENTSEEAAEALERQFGLGKYEDAGGRLGDMTTDELIRHLMSARTYGHVAISEAYEFDESDGLYYISLHRRRQESYDAYITEQGTERLLGILQRYGYVAGNVASRVLPLRETLWLVNRSDIGWYDGQSVFRSVYPHWRSEQLRYRLEDLAANKYADPPQQGKLLLDRFVQYANGLDGAPPTRDDFTEELGDMANKLSNLHSDENGHLLHPDWWEFTQRANQHTYNPAPLLESASHHQRVMAERLYIAWVTQGRKGDGGSRSMVDVQSSIIQDATIDSMQWICNALNRQTVARFMKANFSKLDRSEYPRISFERGAIVTPWWQTNAQAFAQFVSQGIVSISPEDERAVRAASDLPDPSDEMPTQVDRIAAQAGGRLNTAQGQREAAEPGKSRAQPNKFVNRLVDEEELTATQPEADAEGED